MDEKEKLIQLSDRIRVVDIRIDAIENGHIEPDPGELDALRAEYVRLKAEYNRLPEIQEMKDTQSSIHSTRH